MAPNAATMWTHNLATPTEDGHTLRRGPTRFYPPLPSALICVIWGESSFFAEDRAVDSPALTTRIEAMIVQLLKRTTSRKKQSPVD